MKFFSTERLVLFAIILALLIWLISMKTCQNNKFKSQRASLDSTTLASQKKDVTINKLNQLVTTQAVIITDDQTGMKRLADENFNLRSDQKNRIKQYNLLLQTKTTTRIDSFEVAYVDKDALQRFSDSVEKKCANELSYYRRFFIKIPKEVNVDSPYFKFSGTVNRSGFLIRNANFPDIQDIAVTETKGGLFVRNAAGKVKLFSKSKLEINVKHTNPKINIDGIKSVIYSPKKGVWGTVIAAVLAVIGGVYLGTRL